MTLSNQLLCLQTFSRLFRWSILFSLFFSKIEALSAAPVSTKSALATVPLQSVEATQFAIFDGAEWASIQNLYQERTPAKYGYMNVLVGPNQDSERTIGIQSCDKEVYEDSVAKIPSNVRTEDAIATYIASLSAVHAVLPLSENVGGSDEVVVGGKVVVLGSNELACFAAQGLASFNVDVCLVSTGNPKLKFSKGGKVEIVKPAVGSEGIGFSEYVGKFDSLLDTISNERSINALQTAVDIDEDEVADEDDRFENPFSTSSSVLGLLRSRHNCHTYVSTLTHCQNLIAKEGIFGGPKKVDEYAKKVGSPSFVSGNNDCQKILPWSRLGKTAEKLMTAGILFSAKVRQKEYKSCVRGWNLGDFWEQSTWPRDSSGSAQIRFGLPVTDDINLDDIPMVSEAPSRPGDTRFATGKKSVFQEFDFSSKDDLLEESPPKPVQDNPFVHQVAGIQGVREDIIEKDRDCILFLSARYCKTCKTLAPKYTRMARVAKEEAESDILYAKAEVSGRWGKELGRFLEVNAVPAFVLFRNGRRYGSVLSVSKLPSRKIDRAMLLLESGAEWDPVVLKEDEKKS